MFLLRAYPDASQSRSPSECAHHPPALRPAAQRAEVVLLKTGFSPTSPAKGHIVYSPRIPPLVYGDSRPPYQPGIRLHWFPMPVVFCPQSIHPAIPFPALPDCNTMIMQRREPSCPTWTLPQQVCQRGQTCGVLKLLDEGSLVGSQAFCSSLAIHP